MTVWLIDWVTDCWLFMWLIDRLIEWLWLIDWVTDCWLDDYLFDWLIDDW